MRRLKKFLRWTIGVLLVLLTLLLALAFFKDSILRGLAERTIRQQTGFGAAIGQLHFNWRAAQLTIKDLRLTNPPVFGGGTLLDVPEIYLALDAAQAKEGQLHFNEVRLNVAALHLVRNRQGQLNVQLPVKKSPSTNVPVRNDPSVPQPKPKAPGSYQFAGIDKLVLTVGKLTYTDLAHPENSSELDFDIQGEEVTGLETPADINHWLANLVVRIALQEYLKHPAKPQSILVDMLFRGLKRF